MGVCQSTSGDGSGEPEVYDTNSNDMYDVGRRDSLDGTGPRLKALQMLNDDGKTVSEESQVKEDDVTLDVTRKNRGRSRRNLYHGPSLDSNSDMKDDNRRGVEQSASSWNFAKLAADSKHTSSLPRYADDDLMLKQYQAKTGKRNSIVEYIESVRKLHDQQMEFIQKKRTGTLLEPEKPHLKFLPRGGTYVMVDSIGPVQFGLPPETIKDCMSLGLQLPTHYVLPKERFNLQTGINVCEFEFPAYFNFFVLRKRINLITTREVEPLIRTIFQETLLGPKTIELPERYGPGVSKEAYPDLSLEASYFRKNPFDPTSDLSIDTLLQFTYFEQKTMLMQDGTARVIQVATIDNVEIREVGDDYFVYENGVETAEVNGYVILSPPPLRPYEVENKDVYEGLTHYVDEHGEKLSVFIPPAFGLTMLGNSHGFDYKGTTTGFVLWMNRRGIMVDPPPHSGAILKQDGIPSRLIQGIILTHCHADHDAGTFQKILEEGRITLYTTKVIHDSFLRKYSAISGLEREFLEKLFEFREVIIGERISVYGGHLEFHYSLHAIPCVGFSAYYGNKSMIYSGDTLNDKEGIDKIFDGGFMTKERRDSLLNFPWHHTVILHEAGVPPIHTPLKTLIELPEDVKERLYVVHVENKRITPETGLKQALVGPENTIVIDSNRSLIDASLEILDLVANIDLFEDFPVTRSVEILQAAKRLTYNAGDLLMEQGSFGMSMYVIAMGIVSVKVNDRLVKRLTVGDHFGEMSIVTQNPRTATITALTPLEVIEFTGEEFLHLVRYTSAIQRLRHLGSMQQEASWQCINANTVFNNMSSSQKTYLQSILHKIDAKRGDVLWETGEKAKVAVLIDAGKFVFARARSITPFKRGGFVADMPALLYGKPLGTTLVCSENGSVYYITKAMLLKFFDDNPGVLVFFKDRRFVE